MNISRAEDCADSTRAIVPAFTKLTVYQTAADEEHSRKGSSQSLSDNSYQPRAAFPKGVEKGHVHNIGAKSTDIKFP